MRPRANAALRCADPQEEVETDPTLRDNGLSPVEAAVALAAGAIANWGATILRGDEIRGLVRTLGGAR
ncbi:MAG: hypothetical protein ACHQQS_09100 [Thermoanaerobaculales bacterium]